MSVTFIYVLLGVLAWISLRLGTRSVSAALFFTFLIGVVGAFAFPHPTRGIAEQLFSIEIFIEMVAVIFIAFMSVSEEKRQSVRDLEDTVGKLHLTMAEMARADRAKNEFIAILAHELRNPLAPVLSTLELLKQRGGDTESKKLIAAAENQMNMMRRLLDDLLDVARVAQQKFELHKEEASFETLVQQAVNAVQSFVADRDHKLHVDMPKGRSMLFVDPVRFEQVITNLLNNAVKYTERGGEIRLTAKVKGREAIVSVSDNGIGIAPEALSDVFLPFRQMQPTPRRGTGLGIGLSLTKRLVEMHGGTIEAKSDGKGKGSTFTVRLPGAGIVSGTSTQKTKEEKKRQPSSLRILVVDDNQAAADGLARLLEIKEHAVQTAYSGEDAIEKAQSFLPHAILLDIGLPDMDGYEVAKRLRAAEPEAFKYFMVALSGYGQEEDKARAEQAGFNHHITKPARIAEIEEVLLRVRT